MSVSVSAVPFFLIYTVASGIINYIQMEKDINKNMEIKQNGDIHLNHKALDALYNKDFDTNIMDKALLIKTLEEHGATNIQDINDNIICDCETFHLEFTKQENLPYKIKITYNNAYNLDEFVDNIGNEYTSNAQEASYNKIKERLEEQNLEIEQEEIYDDNTIVLTVNLE
jgi:hypothetical protein